MSAPTRFSQMPLSAPVWMWIAYFGVVLALGLTLPSLPAAIFAAMFSFQFWTFACWRGLHRQAAS